MTRKEQNVPGEANASKRFGRCFYALLERADGLVDIYLDGKVYPMTTEDGSTDYDISFLVVRCVDPRTYDDLEAHIREHYDAWRECGEMVWM